MVKPFAAAVRYDGSLPAPLVAITGRGEMARKITEAAVRYGVPLVDGKDIADRLVFLEAGDLVPEELYEPIAEIFAFVMQIDENMGRLIEK